MFVNYHETKPPPETKLYLWRAYSNWRTNTDTNRFIIQFYATYRKRLVATKETYAPYFDYWDGQNLLVPRFLEWTECKDPNAENMDILKIEGLDPVACPFCKTIPKWQYLSTFISSSPIDRTNGWNLKCCSWANTVTYFSPHDLNERRNQLLENTKEIT